MPLFEPCLNPATVDGLMFEQVAELAAVHGIRHIEASIQQVVAIGPRKAADRLEELGVRVAAACGLLPDGLVLPHPLLVNGAAYRAALTGIAARARAFTTIGCPVATLVVNPRTDLPPEQAHDTAATRLREIAAICADHGVTLALEAVGVSTGLPNNLTGEHPFIRTLPELRRFLDQVGDVEGVGVCVDAFHWAATGADPSHLTELGRWPISHVQIADGPAGTTPSRWADAMRLYPGDGAMPWPAFTAALHEAGYTGPLSVEIFNPDLRRASAEKIADRARDGALAVRGIS